MTESKFSDYKNPRTEIRPEIVEGFEDECQFNELAVELLREVGSIAIALGGIERLDSDKSVVPYSLDESALIGNMVRLSKLIVAFIEQFVKERSETSIIFSRCIAETYVNLKYMLKHGDVYTLRHYRKHSLRQDKKMLDIIKSNVRKTGVSEHIEHRIMNSLYRSFDQTDFEEAEINNSSKWDDKIKSRISEILGPQTYVILYGIGSNVVHGNWQDLTLHHLDHQNSGFLPQPGWTFPRPQIILPTTLLCTDIAYEYSEKVLPDGHDKKELLETLEDILTRADSLDQLYEQYLQKTSTYP